MTRIQRILRSGVTLGLLLSAPAFAGWEEGVAAYKARNYSQAIQEFQGVVGAQPEYAGGHMMLGRSFLAADRAQEAVSSLRKAYDLDPANVGTQVVLGQAFVKASRYADAATLLSKINVASLPSSQQASVNQLKAIALQKSGNTSSAIAALGDSVAKNPNDADTQYQYGVMLFNDGQTGRAVSALDKAVSLSADAEKLRALADAALRQGREERSDSGKRAAYAKSVAAATRLVSASGSFDNLMRLGQAQLGGKQYADSIGTFQRAASANNSDWLPTYYIGQAQTATGSYSAAANSLQDALRKTNNSSNTAKIWSALGFVYEKQKNWPQARTAYEKAGDSRGVTRVNENEETDKFNADVDAETRELAKLADEERRLREELEKLQNNG